MGNVRASFDTTTMEGEIKAFNAQNGSSVSLKNLENGEVIECNGVMQYDEMVSSYGQSQESTITVLFGTDGNSYAGVSDTVAKAGEKLIDLVAKLKLEKFNVAIIKQKSGKGQEFLNIRLVM